MQSFLLKEGDELVTTDQEHGSLRTIAQYLSETRGIVVRKHHVRSSRQLDPDFDLKSDAKLDNESTTHCQGLLSLVNEKTKLVAVSEIVSYTGWRPDLTMLAEELETKGVPLIADCAHGPGQMLCRPKRYPMWVGSAHKWLGAPNGTAFAYVRPDLAERLIPVTLSDTYYGKRDLNAADLSRLEGTGTGDQARWRGLTRAIDLHLSLGVEAVVQYQIELAKYLRHKLETTLGPQFRTSNSFESAPHECTSMLNFRFGPERLKVPNLQDYLWHDHKIAVQLDYLNIDPGKGMRVSCHVSNSKEEIDRLLNALASAVIK
jgi:isopenicillin-N epimerase